VNDQYAFMPMPLDDVSDKINELDGLFWNTSIVLLVLATICFSPVAFFVGLAGCFRCQDPIARRRAVFVTMGSLAVNAIYTIIVEFNKLN